LEFPFSDFPEIRISKKNPTGISGTGNRIGILLLMGVPEIGTEKRNSQPSRGAVILRHESKIP
jgi:hypothetical protein